MIGKLRSPSGSFGLPPDRGNPSGCPGMPQSAFVMKRAGCSIRNNDGSKNHVNQPQGDCRGVTAATVPVLV